MNHAYYYRQVTKELRFIIPPGSSVLYFGCYNGVLIEALQPSRSVAVFHDEVINPVSIPGNAYVRSEYKNYIPSAKFDYIVVDAALGKTDDICLFLRNLMKACTMESRIIIRQENRIWRPLLWLGARVGLKSKEVTRNWLSLNDLRTYLAAMGYEPTRLFRRNLIPVKVLFFGPLLNYIASILPIFDWLMLDEFVIARKVFLSEGEENPKPSLTICLTVRDEAGNIEPMVKSIPSLCPQQEILFVEGHSTDSTVEEIKKMQSAYPGKNIRLLHQSGYGQGDAIRLGFREAVGSIIILYEGDGTSEPHDIQHFYECMRENRFEFIEGSRFFYPFLKHSMPFLNKVGNYFFSTWFSWFYSTQSTDILSGIKAIGKENFKKVDRTWGFLESTDPFGDFELLFGSVRHGLKMGEIPIHYRAREYGQSKTRIFSHGSYLLKFMWKAFFVFRLSRISKTAS